VNNLEKAIALITLAEQTFESDYYGENIVAFRKRETHSCIDASEQFTEFTER